MTQLLVETIPLGPIQTNCYVIHPESANVCWIIDPGGLPKPVIERIEAKNLQPEMLIVTHGHWDHFIGNRCLKDRWPQLPIAIHETDAPALPDPNVNLSLSFLGRFIKSPEADRLLRDGDRLALGNLELEVIHTPGHCPGSICLYCDQIPAAFVGDLIFAGGGVGRTDLPHSSTEQLYESIQRFLTRIRPETTLYPGHGPPTSAEQERSLLLGSF